MDSGEEAVNRCCSSACLRRFDISASCCSRSSIWSTLASSGVSAPGRLGAVGKESRSAAAASAGNRHRALTPAKVRPNVSAARPDLVRGLVVDRIAMEPFPFLRSTDVDFIGISLALGPRRRGARGAQGIECAKPEGCFQTCELSYREIGENSEGLNALAPSGFQKIAGLGRLNSLTVRCHRTFLLLACLLVACSSLGDRRP